MNYFKIIFSIALILVISVIANSQSKTKNNLNILPIFNIKMEIGAKKNAFHKFISKSQITLFVINGDSIEGTYCNGIFHDFYFSFNCKYVRKQFDTTEIIIDPASAEVKYFIKETDNIISEPHGFLFLYNSSKRKGISFEIFDDQGRISSNVKKYPWLKRMFEGKIIFYPDLRHSLL